MNASPGNEAPDTCPRCGPVRFFTWTKYESLAAMDESGKYNVACSRCGYLLKLDDKPLWGGLDITRHTDGSTKRDEKSRKAGT